MCVFRRYRSRPIVSVLAAKKAQKKELNSPIDPDLPHIRSPPAPPHGKAAPYFSGPHRQGRDVTQPHQPLGARGSLGYVFVAMCILICGPIGCAFGLIAGYLGGWIHLLIMRTVDFSLSLLWVSFVLPFAVTLGPSFWVVVITPVVVSVPTPQAAVRRAEMLKGKTRDFIALARIAGAGPGRIIFVHILPNVLNSIVVPSTLQVGGCDTGEASLSFLGAGVPPPTRPGMIADGRNYVDTLSGFSRIAVRGRAVIQPVRVTGCAIHSTANTTPM